MSVRFSRSIFLEIVAHSWNQRIDIFDFHFRIFRHCSSRFSDFLVLCVVWVCVCVCLTNPLTHSHTQTHTSALTHTQTQRQKHPPTHNYTKHTPKKLTLFDIVPVNGDIVISVHTTLFVKEAKAVHHFVDCCTQFVRATWYLCHKVLCMRIQDLNPFKFRLSLIFASRGAKIGGSDI